MCYGGPMLEIDELLAAALRSTDSWEKQEKMLRGFGLEGEDVEAIREVLAQEQAEAVMRIVKGPDA